MSHGNNRNETQVSLHDPRERQIPPSRAIDDMMELSTWSSDTGLEKMLKRYGPKKHKVNASWAI